jgi:chorismate synthase
VIRFLTAGESHGPALLVIVEGVPAGLAFDSAALAGELARRRLGFGRGPRMRIEKDEVRVLSGIRHGRTLGSPVAIEIANTEWEKWKDEMSVEPGTPSRPLTQPRPGHADLVGMLKYGFKDARNVLERASARETAARVAAGCMAKSLLATIGVSVLSHTVQIGQARVASDYVPRPEDLPSIDSSPVRCLDPKAEAAMVAEIEAAAKEGDSLGGVSEVVAWGVPVGLGSYVHWDRRLDGLLAQAAMSINAVKGVEVGGGFALASLRGSKAHDPIVLEGGRIRRPGVRSGGTEGGVSTGAPLVVRLAMKPLATLNKPVLPTVDVVTHEAGVSFKERTDVTAVPAMGVVAEAMVALVLASEALRKFGGDSVGEFRANYDSYKKRLREDFGFEVDPVP